MVRVDFRRKFEHGTASLRHVCNHKEVFPASRLSHVRILQVAHRLEPFLTAARIIKCIILMADCDPHVTHVNEIKLYSSFKCASDYR